MGVPVLAYLDALRLTPGFLLQNMTRNSEGECRNIAHTSLGVYLYCSPAQPVDGFVRKRSRVFRVVPLEETRKPFMKLSILHGSLLLIGIEQVE